MKRNGAPVVLVGALVGAGLLGCLVAIWYTRAVKAAGSGADAVMLVYFFAAPAAMMVGAIFGAIVLRFMKQLSRGEAILLAIAAIPALAYSLSNWWVHAVSWVLA
jgi:hypothetical protein